MTAKLTRTEMLAQNTAALEEAQPGLAAGLREIPADYLDRMEAMPIPDVDLKRLSNFAAAAAEQATGDALIILGLGPPQMAKLLRDAMPADRGLIFLEPTLEVAVRLLSQHDYRESLVGGLTAVVCAGTDISLQTQVESLVVGWGVSELQLIGNPMRPLGDKVGDMVGRMLKSALQSIELATSTGSMYGRDSVSSILGNLRAATAGQDLSPLLGSLKGTPAFVVGAGPSLDSDAWLLPRLKDRGVVIACDTALPVLLAHQVDPDIVVTLDIAETKAVLFERHYVKDALLVALTGTNPDLVDAWIGPRGFVADNHPLSDWAAPYLAPAVALGQLGNVAQLGYAMARVMGCDPVVLCGVDMAPGSDGSMYASGVEHDAPRRVTDLPDRLRSTMVPMPSNDAGEVLTLRNMAVYAEALGAMASKVGATFNTSRGGIKITGVPFAPLESVINSLPESGLARPLVGTPPIWSEVEQRRSTLAEALGALESELRSFAADASNFADATDSAGARLGDHLDSEEEVVRSLQPDLTAFGRHKGVIAMLEPLQPAVNFEINRLLRRTRAMKDPVERARSRLLALGGPAASGAQLAEFIADQAQKARVGLLNGDSGRHYRV